MCGVDATPGNVTWQERLFAVPLGTPASSINITLTSNAQFSSHQACRHAH